jgi:bacillithiol biosynthesis cysteine-adding enzyme BshC
VALGELPGTGEQPVARVTLDGSVDETLTTLEALLPPTEFTADVVSALRRSYQPGAGMADAFARWMESVLGPRGLVVFDSSDSASKPLLADVFAREIEQRSTSSLAARAGSALEALGYHAQATPADATLALFHQNDGRHPIRLDAGGGYLIDGRRVSQAELLADVRSRPDAFSPGVLLRPIAQDTLFPTVCYVSGPSELAYLGQLKEVYASFGVPMPLVQQRATATVVDGNAMRFFRRQGVQLERLRAQDESALNDLLGSQLPPGIDASLERTGRAVEAEMQALAESVAALDPTLEGAARSTLSRMQDDLKRLHAKILQAAKRKDDTLRRQFHHARAQAFPAGQPQERQLAGVYFLDRYGPALLDRLLDILPGEPGMHYLITV